MYDLLFVRHRARTAGRFALAVKGDRDPGLWLDLEYDFGYARSALLHDTPDVIRPSACIWTSRLRLNGQQN